MSHSDQKGRPSLREMLNEEQIFRKGVQYKSYDEVLDRIDGYFDFCADTDKPPTITGISLYLGFSCREELIEFVKTTRDRSLEKVFRVAITLIEHEYESMLHRPRMAASSAFALKNLGWQDSLDVSGKQKAGIREIEINVKRAHDRQDNDRPDRKVRSLPGTVQV